MQQPLARTPYAVRLINFAFLWLSVLHSASAMGVTNDHYADRITLNGSFTNIQAVNFGATAEPGEPRHSTAAGSAARASVWYRWVAPSAGGVVLGATPDFTTPIIAVYTNKPGSVSATNLGRVADNSSTLGPLRCAFTAVAGQEYAFALDGILNFGGAGEGNFSLSLISTPAPVNNHFANATVIADTYYTNFGSFLGSGREAGETNHGAPDFTETLWWNWTAPTNTLNSTIPVRLTADAVSFPPVVAVYVGNSVASLSAVPLVSTINHFENVDPSSTFSMTRETIFAATPGVTYRIALAGRQNFPNVISPRYGNYRFRLSTRALSLSFTNMNTGFDFDGSRPFTGTARITNLGPTNSRPLRLIISVAAGVSVRGIDSGYTDNSAEMQATNDVPPVAAGATASVEISGDIPAVTENGDTGIGWGAYAELQEESIPGSWFTIERALIGFDDWPRLGDSPGPTGGVIRLDPNYIGASAHNRLSNVSILGRFTAVEGSSLSFTGRSAYVSGAIHQFTNTAWAVTNTTGSSAPFAITTNGIFTAGFTTNDAVVRLSAPYSYAGFLYASATNIFITNLPSPALSNLRSLTNRRVAFTVSGVPGRGSVVETATNIPSPPVNWVPLLTNAPLSGVFTFTNQVPTNVPRRFFRVRELPP